MAPSPYPLPRSTRRTAVMMGNGGTTYGPFGAGWGIFDTADVVVWAKALGEAGFSSIAATVTKTAGAIYDTFSISVAGGIAATTQFYVEGARVHERSVAVTRGGALSAAAMELELSKLTAVLQELRRDVLSLADLTELLQDTLGASLQPGTGVDVSYNDATGRVTISFVGIVGGGNGNVIGPAAAVDGRLAAFDGVTGRLLKDSGISANGFGNVFGPAAAVDSNLAAYDTATGKLLKDSAIPLSRVVQKDGSGNVGLGVAASARLTLGGETSQFATSLVINPTGHATSRRAGIGLDNWIVGQDAGGAGVNDFFLYSGVASAAVFVIDPSGNVKITRGTLGYGPGSGGTVTQLTNKNTGVTLNKACGQIIMNAAALAAGATAFISFSNSLLEATDILVVTIGSTGFGGNYEANVPYVVNGGAGIRVKNVSAGSLSEAVVVNFQINKGANS